MFVSSSDELQIVIKLKPTDNYLFNIENDSIILSVVNNLFDITYDNVLMTLGNTIQTIVGMNKRHNRQHNNCVYHPR